MSRSWPVVPEQGRWLQVKCGRLGSWYVQGQVPGQVPEGPVVVTSSFTGLEWNCCRSQPSGSGRFSAGAQKRVLAPPKRMLRLSAHGNTSEAYLIVTYGLICVLAILASHSGSSMFDVLILHAHKIHQVQGSLSDCENGIGPWQDRICQ